MVTLNSDLSKNSKLIQKILDSIGNKKRAKNSGTNPFLKKRDAKLACKKLDAVGLYFNEHLKPRQIAKKLRIGVDSVYRIVEKFKHEIQQTI